MLKASMLFENKGLKVFCAKTASHSSIAQGQTITTLTKANALDLLKGKNSPNPHLIPHTLKNETFLVSFFLHVLS
ncbi:hypothetical protein GCM10011391_17250 [Pullulanibacillus camelliae]|uniref:Uncharacterized protein n=1 Tax=Pullulanibacillus camelliae TaxID=1707096 RepID=A0A8J2YEV5_9BACL|nr:hypothetical protein GCM10011391_17250 [Pullulanibacillus camelliae]